MKCPKCGGEDIAVTVQYCKATIWKILKLASLIALIVTVIFNMAEVIEYYELDKNAQLQSTTIIQTVETMQNKPFATADTYHAMPLIAIFLICFTVFELLQIYTESKTQIYYVCKECKKIWHDIEDFK